jgi:hypothetical protein
VPTDELQLHPGIDGEDAVFRWTAPSSGAFFITGKFEGLDSTTTDVHILLNGGTLLSGSIGSNGAAVPFTLTTGVNAGDHLDFVVGFGPTTTSLTARVSRQLSLQFPSRIPLLWSSSAYSFS